MISTTCNTCAYYSNSTCNLTRRPASPDHSSCAARISKDKIGPCDLCHSTSTLHVAIAANNTYLLCPNCFSSLGTCRTCASQPTCSFETDPNPLPKLVQKRIQQDNMVQVITVPNPERISALCTSCPCYNPEGYCNKECNTCASWNLP